MQIDKKEFRMKFSKTQSPEELIHQVLYQFEPNVQSKSLRAFTIRRHPNLFKMRSDWDKFKLVIFNILQNAVKYNSFEGFIIIILNCLPARMQNEEAQDEQDYVFEVEILDTGIGISKER